MLYFTPQSTTAMRLPPSPLHSYASPTVTRSTKFTVSYDGSDASSRSAVCGSRVVSAPIITPWERMRRVMARVSTPWMPGTPSSARYVWSVRSES